jgi:hypothetical protein
LDFFVVGAQQRLFEVVHARGTEVGNFTDAAERQLRRKSRDHIDGDGDCAR